MVRCREFNLCMLQHVYLRYLSMDPRKTYNIHGFLCLLQNAACQRAVAAAVEAQLLRALSF